MYRYVAVTGHRPDKLGGYDLKARRRLVDFATSCLPELVESGDWIITGMAQGWDQAVAWACVDLNIPFVAAVPCEKQESRWPWEAQMEYRFLLGKASSYALINREYTPSCMQERNKWMVDRCDSLISLYDGSSGGTRNCVNYAKGLDKPVLNLYNKWKSLH